MSFYSQQTCKKCNEGLKYIYIKIIEDLGNPSYCSSGTEQVVSAWRLGKVQDAVTHIEVQTKAGSNTRIAKHHPDLVCTKPSKSSRISSAENAAIGIDSGKLWFSHHQRIRVTEIYWSYLKLQTTSYES